MYRQPNNPGLNQRPGSAQFKTFLKKLDSTLSNLQSPLPDILLCGDFNLPYANWTTGGPNGPATTDQQTMIKDLFNLANNHFLIQVIDFATHIAGNTLDLIFTNNSNYIHTSTAHKTALSDHLVVECKFQYEVPQNKPPENQPKGDPSFYDLNFFSESVDWFALTQSLSDIDWNRHFLKSNPSDMMETFLSICLDKAKLHVPLKRQAEMSNKKASKIPHHRRVLMRNRKNVQKQILKTKSESRIHTLNRKLIEIEKKLQSSQNSEKAAEEKKAVDRIKTNPKYFYSYAQRFSKVKTGIGPLFDASKTLTACATKMSEILSEQNPSVFTDPILSDSEIKNLHSTSSSNQKISDVFFDEVDIEEAIDELSQNSAAGPDNFPSKFLKECKSALITPILLIWRESLNQGQIPLSCKSANIVPIYKGQGKNRAEAKNYRPVALTSILIKIFEKVVRKTLVEYFDKHNLFNQNQHGFRRARSCISQLLSHFDRVIRLLEEGKIVDVIYLDFAKAFDKVDIGLTLKKTS